MSNDDDWAGGVAAAGEHRRRARLAASAPPRVQGADPRQGRRPRQLRGKRKAGTIYAGSFLEQFVDGETWAHLDIAGTAWDVGREYVGKGPSGYRGPAARRAGAEIRRPGLIAAGLKESAAMDFELTDEQRLLRDTVRDFARNEVAPRRRPSWTATKSLPLRARRADGRARADGDPVPGRVRGRRRRQPLLRARRSRSSPGSTPRSRSRWPPTPRSGRCPYTCGATDAAGGVAAAALLRAAPRRVRADRAGGRLGRRQHPHPRASSTTASG